MKRGTYKIEGKDRTKTRFNKSYNLPELTSISERADIARDRKVDPLKDNMLKIINEDKKLVLDQRFINPLLPDDSNSKVNTCVKNIYSVWDKHRKTSLTQFVFSDMSTPKNDCSFNICDDIKEKLMDMGTGTNVQGKLIAIHDLNVPWSSADLAQHSGGVARRSNENKDVKVFMYVTESILDSYFVVETKGSMCSMDLGGIENSKSNGAIEHFKAIGGENDIYHVFDNFENLLYLVKS